MQLLEATGPADDDVLLQLYAYPESESAWVRANFVASIDGAAYGEDRRSGSLGDAADRRVFDVLRALAQVVLIGAGTARDEGYTPLAPPTRLLAARAAAGLDADLELAVVTASGKLPDALLRADRPPLVVTRRQCAMLADLRGLVGRERVLVHGSDEVDLRAALADLAERGFGRVLCEGGPLLFGSMLQGGLVDELCLTTSPRLVGSTALRITDARTWLQPPAGARLAHVLRDGDTLLARWLLSG